LPPDVRRWLCLAENDSLNVLGLRPLRRHSRIGLKRKSLGKAEPFRTSGGKAAQTELTLNSYGLKTFFTSENKAFLLSRCFDYLPILKKLLLLILLLFTFLFPLSAHEGEDHSKDGKEKKPSAGVRVAERNVESSVGKFSIKLAQTPSDPRTGEEIKFIFVISEKIEGGFAGSQLQALKNANVTAKITNIADNLQAQANDKGEYVLNYAFNSAGDYKIVFDVRTNDNRNVSTDFPVSVVRAPTNWIFWVGATIISLLSFGAIAGYVSKLKGKAKKIRRTIPAAVAALLFFIVGVSALAYFSPPKKTRSQAEIQTAIENGDAEKPNSFFSTNGETITVSKESQQLFGIRTEEVMEKEITAGLKVNGVVKTKPDARAIVAPPVSRRIFLRKGLTVGSAVGRGEQIGTVEQVLTAAEQSELETRRAELRTAELEQQAKQAEQKARLQQARTRLAQARIELQRALELYNAGVESKQHLEEAQNAVNLAEQEVKIAEEQAAFANRQAKISSDSASRVNPVRTFALISPITGLINEIKVATGQQVEAGNEILNVTNLTNVFLEAQVFESELEKVRSPKKASFTASGIPNETYKIGEGGDGFLLTIGQTVNAETQTVPVIFEVKNPLNRLRDGMFVEITIDTSGNNKVIAVPKRAIVNEQGKNFVFADTNGICGLMDTTRFERVEKSAST
jgi:RND family efflux transporter MFP subunit